MAQDTIAADVAAFIIEVMDSVATMEACTLSYRERSVCWSASEMAGRLYVDEARAKESLERLVRYGVLRFENGRYGYAPLDSELEALISCVVQTYDRQLIPVTNLIHSRVKPSITEFANAFRMRKER
jgi:hypothetical protein